MCVLYFYVPKDCQFNQYYIYIYIYNPIMYIYFSSKKQLDPLCTYNSNRNKYIVVFCTYNFGQCHK